MLLVQIWQRLYRFLKLLTHYFKSLELLLVCDQLEKNCASKQRVLVLVFCWKIPSNAKPSMTTPSNAAWKFQAGWCQKIYRTFQNQILGTGNPHIQSKWHFPVHTPACSTHPSLASSTSVVPSLEQWLYATYKGIKKKKKIQILNPFVLSLCVLSAGTA